MSSIKNIRRNIRSTVNCWIAEQSLQHLEAIRKYELDVVLGLLPKEGRLLEIGAGTGWQSQVFESRGFDVSAIDIPSSNYKSNRVREITEYDGSHIPFCDNEFDIIFSSNVLEHIPHIHDFQQEIHRVLKKSGLAVHVLPSSNWRIWTNITNIVKFWSKPKKHGEHAGNAFSEIAYFSRQWWVKFFEQSGWEILDVRPSGLFYTGNSIMDSRLSIPTRRVLSRFIGSSSNIFLLKSR